MRALDRILKGRGGSQLLPLVTLIRGMFRNGEQGAWYDPSDFLPNWRRNLLTYTEQFDNAYWTKTGATITSNAAVAPDGTSTADKLVEDTANSLHNVQGGPTVISGVAYTGSVYLKAAERTSVTVRTGGGGLPDSGAIINLSSGVISSQFGSPTSVSISSAGNGWYQVSIVNTSASSASGRIYVALNASTPASPNGQTYTGDGTSGIYIWGAQLEVGSTATAYQKITDGIQDYYTAQAQPVLFQDSAGTTPVTAVEQPVGLMLDKSKGLVLGSEKIVNGGFDSSADWSLQTGVSITGSELVFASVGSTLGAIQTVSTYNSNAYYKVTVVITSLSAGQFRVKINSGTLVLLPASVGTHTIYVYSGTIPASGLEFVAAGTTTGSVANISVRELPGNHAFQSTSASRPVLSARVNLLTKTEQFDDAVWGKQNITVSKAGSVSTLTTAAGRAGIWYSTVIRPEQVQNTKFFKIKKGSHRYVVISSGQTAIGSTINADYTFPLGSVFDLETGVFLSTPPSNLSAVSMGDGWYALQHITPSANTVSQYNSGLSLVFCTETGLNMSAAGLTVQLEYADARVSNDGVGLPAYQRVNTSTDYDTAGFPLYLKTDGVDDWMQTNSINFTSTDKMTVWAGVRKLSDVARGMFVELSTSPTTNFFNLEASGPTAGANYGALLAGSSVTSVNGTTFAAPITNGIAVQYDIAKATRETELLMRVNGTIPTLTYANAADAGTGNFGNYPLYLFRRGGTSLPFNGRMYGLIVRGAQSTGTQISNGEKYINSKTKAF